MKILLATYWYMPHVGGVNVYVNVLKKELENAGHEVDVLAHHPDMTRIYMLDSNQEIKKSKIKDVVYDRVYKYYAKYLPHVSPWIRWRDIERYTFELAASYFDLTQYDLIHTQDIVSTRALWRVKPENTALVSTVHGLLANEHIISGDIKSKEGLLWRYAAEEEYFGSMSSDVTIVPSRWLRRELSHHFAVPKEKLTVIPYGMDIYPFLEKLHQDPYPPVEVRKGETIFACPARLVPVKGHATLIEALAKLRRKRRDFRCWLIGDGKLRKKLEQEVKRLNLQRHVEFMGDRGDVPSLLKKAHVVVLPSLQDNLPFTIMEAQIAEKAIVASDAGGIPEMIEHGKTGLLFPKKDSTELARKLLYLLEDPKRQIQLGKQAKKWGKRQWSPHMLYERTMNAYEKALQNYRVRQEG